MSDFVPIKTFETQRVALNVATVASFDNPTGQAVFFRLLSKRFFHFKTRLTSDTPDATIEDAPVCDRVPIIIPVGSGESIDFFLGTGETAGDVWVTRVAAT